MYPWQAAALECGEGGANLVYCAPTSGGKSLVAEVLLLRCLLAASGTTWRHGRGVRCSAVLVPHGVLRRCCGKITAAAPPAGGQRHDLAAWAGGALLRCARAISCAQEL